jgi:hypothetical protein
MKAVCLGCATKMTILIELLQGGSVDEELVLRWKKQLLTIDRWGNMLLHVTYYLKAHALVLGKFLKAASLASSLLMVREVKDQGATLHCVY